MSFLGFDLLDIPITSFTSSGSGSSRSQPTFHGTLADFAAFATPAAAAAQSPAEDNNNNEVDDNGAHDRNSIMSDPSQISTDRPPIVIELNLEGNDDNSILRANDPDGITIVSSAPSEEAEEFNMFWSTPNTPPLVWRSVARNSNNNNDISSNNNNLHTNTNTIMSTGVLIPFEHPLSLSTQDSVLTTTSSQYDDNYYFAGERSWQSASSSLVLEPPVSRFELFSSSLAGPSFSVTVPNSPISAHGGALICPPYYDDEASLPSAAASAPSSAASSVTGGGGSSPYAGSLSLNPSSLPSSFMSSSGSPLSVTSVAAAGMGPWAAAPSSASASSTSSRATSAALATYSTRPSHHHASANDSWILVSNLIRDSVSPPQHQHDSSVYIQVGDQLAALPAAVATAGATNSTWYERMSTEHDWDDLCERVQAVWAVLQQDSVALPAGGGLSTPEQVLAFLIAQEEEMFWKRQQNDGAIVSASSRRRGYPCSWKRMGETALLAATVSAFTSMGVHLLLRRR